MDCILPPRLRPYRHLLGSYDFAATIADASRQDCPIIWANARFFALTGYPPEAVLGRNCRFLQSDRPNAKARRRLRAGIAFGRPVDALLENVTADGRLFLNHLILRPLGAERDLFVGAQNDVTNWMEVATNFDPIGGETNFGPAAGELRALSVAKWVDRLARARPA